MLFKKLAVVVASAAALTFSASLFAQTAPQASEDNPMGPAGEVIAKLARMGEMQFGEFPVSQTELDRASEFIINQAAQNGKTITRDQALVALGYISGQLGIFMNLQNQAAMAQAQEQQSQQTSPAAQGELQAAPQASQQSEPQAQPAAPVPRTQPQQPADQSAQQAGQQPAPQAPQAGVVPPQAVQQQLNALQNAEPGIVLMPNGPMMQQGGMMIPVQPQAQTPETSAAPAAQPAAPAAPASAQGAQQ